MPSVEYHRNKHLKKKSLSLKDPPTRWQSNFLEVYLSNAMSSISGQIYVSNSSSEKVLVSNRV